MRKELVSVEWLQNNLSNDNLVLLDVSPKQTVTGKTSSNSELCIPHARIVDVKQQFTNKESDFPNTVPSPSQFEQACQALGINSNSSIVVYDNRGVYLSPRVWWLFKTMGHENVSVLDGGLPEWIKNGYQTVKKSETTQEFKTGDFKSNFNKQHIVTYQDVMDNIESNKFLIVDARSAGRFQGTDKEPRKHLKSGSIPHSINIPYQSLLEDGKFKSTEKLKELFKETTSSDKKLVFSCGSGITACIVMLASEMAHKKSKHLYDGSWTEYAELNQLIIE